MDVDRYDRYYLVGEVARITRQTERTVYRWIARGQLSAIRLPGGGTLIAQDELDRWLRPRPDPPAEPVAAQEPEREAEPALPW